MENQTILEWQSPEHYFDKKSNDWYWILGIIVLGASVLSFYFGNLLFGILLIVAGVTVGILSYKETRTVIIRITTMGITWGDKSLYPWGSYRSFWIEDEHVNGARILLHPRSSYLPLTAIPVNEEVDLNDLHDILFEFLDEEPLEESLVHKWFDKLIARW